MSTSWDELEARARQRFPERYAPDGTPLVEYGNECRHTSDERIRGLCGDAWQHRLASWERAHAGEPAIPDEDELEDTRDQDTPYARARGGA